MFYEELTITNKDRETKDIKELVVQLYDNNHDIPLLVIFANKLLKMARNFFENIRDTDRYHTLNNFFELFYNLACAGPEIKRYMLQCRFVSRLLDIYNHKRSQDRFVMRDLSYLPTYELICNKNGENSKDSDDSDEYEGEEFDFGLSLLKPKIESDDLIVEREKKSYYRSNHNEEDGGYGLQALDKKEDLPEKRFAYLIRAI